MKYRNIILIMLIITGCNKQREYSSTNYDVNFYDSIKSSGNLENVQLKKIEISDYAIRNDTLWILSGDKFLYYPFGIYKKVDDLKSAYPFMNRRQLLDNEELLNNFYFKRSSIVSIFDNESGTGLVEIVYAKISDSEIILANNLQTGLNKLDFFDYLPVQLSIKDQNKIKIVLLESDLLGMWNYYYFSNDVLDSITFTTDYQIDVSNIKFANEQE
jgi:hypothetical protein